MRAEVRRAALSLWLGAVLVGACVEAPPPTASETTEPTSPPAELPSASATLATFEIRPELWMNDDPAALRERHRADGDITLTFRLDFFSVMDRTSVIAAVRRRAPNATGFRWDNGDQSVRFDFASGLTTITIDPGGARSLSGGGTVVPITWTIERPATEVVLFDPSALARGDQTPIQRYKFPVTPGGVVQFDPRGEIALLWHGSTGRPRFSFVELRSGRRTPLPAELAKIASNGARQLWLPDGRFLTIGTHDTIVAGPLGQNMRSLTPLVGQSGIVSPSGTRLAVWSYAEATAAIVDLDSGAVTSLGGGYLRCNVDGGVSLAWSPDSRTVAISHCTHDMAGPSRTVYADASSGRAVATIADSSVAAWLGDGRKILRSWPASEDPRRQPDPTLRVIDAAGRPLSSISAPSAFEFSPDGRWLLDFGTDPQHQAGRVIDLRDGHAYPIPGDPPYATWAPFSFVAVSRAAP